jgi:hypothetical protein
MAYLAYNPIDAGLCDRPEDWPWSSYRAVIGHSRASFLQLDELLRLFAFDRGEARRRIEEYVRGFEATRRRNGRSDTDMAGVRPQTWPARP